MTNGRRRLPADRHSRGRPALRPGGHAARRSRWPALAICCLLLAPLLMPLASRHAPRVIAGPALQSACPPDASGAPPVPNWGAFDCSAETAAPVGITNWGSTRGVIGRSVDRPAPVAKLEGEIGQAAGEVGVAPLIGLCSTPPCGVEQHELPTGVCSDPPCEGAAVVLPEVCSSPPCGGTPISLPTGLCSTPPCPRTTVVASTVTAGKPSLAQLPLDPKWHPVIQWLDDVLAAQQQVMREVIDPDNGQGVMVPTNVVLAEILIESQGVMPADANYVGAVGLLQVTGMTIGADRYDLARATRDPAYSIYIGVTELALRYLDSKSYNTAAPGKPLPWQNIIVGFFSGHYFPTGAADAYNTDYQYQQLFIQYMNELERAGGVRGVAGADSFDSVIPANWLAAVGQAITGLAYLWGGNTGAPLTQEFGPTDFSVNVQPDWYSYSLEYGFTQPGHTGLDVGVPAGTPLYAPANSVVYCAGTFNPGFPDEEACAAFADVTNDFTSGRLQLKLPGSGDMLILGHVRSTVVKPGASVKVGELIGYTGSMNGDHVHVEYRRQDTSTGSGWRLIDPRLTRLNGLFDPNSPFLLTPAPTPSAPTEQPTVTPTEEVVPTEAVEPTKVIEPTREPTLEPTVEPTVAPEPTLAPTTEPVVTAEPTAAETEIARAPPAAIANE